MTICQAEGCDSELRCDNSLGFCRSHLSVTSRLPVRVCAIDGCVSELRVTNKTGYCYRCYKNKNHRELTAAEQAYNADYNAMLRARTAKFRAERPQCSVDGCTNGLRRDNHTGKCRWHNHLADRAQCAYEGCANLLIATNQTGRCEEHSAKFWVAAQCGADGCEKPLKGHNLTGFCGVHTNGYRRDYMLQRLYGITLEQYDSMMAEQNGVCALCGRPADPNGVRAASRLHVDHDHETQRVRALLCNRCNRGLGDFCDDPALMRRAADYIERNRAEAA
jgi:Recombination endonuclease VII